MFEGELLMKIVGDDVSHRADARLFLGGGDKNEYDYFDSEYDPYFDDGFGPPGPGGPHFMNRDSDEGYHQDDHFAAQLSRFSLTDFFENLLNLSRS